MAMGGISGKGLGASQTHHLQFGHGCLIPIMLVLDRSVEIERILNRNILNSVFKKPNNASCFLIF